MKDKKIQKLAEKYLQGQASEAEKQLLHQWYDQQLPKDEEIIVMRKSSKLEVRNRMLSQLKQIASEEKDQTSRSHRIVKWSIAASLLIIIVAGIGFQQYFSAVEWVVVEVPYGETQEVVLPDNSTVWINAGSTFTYPVQFSADNRMVELLEGEAFFEVIRDESRPFSVQAKDLNVSVLGTSFDIKTYREESLSKVSVVSGNVAVKYEKQSIPTHLLAGEQVVVNNVEGWMEKQSQAISSVAAWKDDRIAFEDEILSEVVSALKRKYNVNIEIASEELALEKVSIKLNDESLENVLEVLKYILDIQYERNDDRNIVIKK